MYKVQFLNESMLRDADVRTVNEHVVEVTGVPQNLSGFHIMNSNGSIFGKYDNYTTLYRTVGNGFQLSDDGSTYKEPEETGEYEPYEPTLDELKQQKISEVSNACQQTIHNGFDVQLSSGETKHYSLKTEDQINLMGKQVQLTTSSSQFEYHADGQPCEWYSRTDMQKIVDTAFQFVSMNTTYCNSLYQYINSMTDKSKVQAIVYGIDIPEQYQSPVYKDYLAKMKA